MLATFSGLVSSLNGTSGAEAKRDSITPNATSSASRVTIGPIAANALQPYRPACTTP